MAYFECSTGSASSGDGVALIVECDADFAGSTITADNGEDIFTETCPSVSPYTVRFEGIPTGTYTISGVSGGATITKQFTVLDYTATLHIIPNGKTVTPVNDIQTWLHCGDIWDKTYTTLNQVLADSPTLLALISSNNAADYMARSTSWASSVCANQTAMGYIGNNDYCADTLLANATWRNAICNSGYFESVLNVKVPTMTGSTTPYGEVTRSSEYSARDAWRAFSGGTASSLNYGWCPGTQTINNWVQYNFPSDVVIHKVNYQVGYAGYTINLILQGINNGTATDLATLETLSDSAWHTSDVVNATPYNGYRIVDTTGNSYLSYGLKLQFYGRA